MLRLWRWTYARLYVRTERFWGRAEQPALTAACGTAIVILANLFSLAWTICLLTGQVPDLQKGRPYAVAIILVTILVVYWAYEVKGGAKELIRRMRKQSRQHCWHEESRMWMYILGSAAMPAAISFVVRALGG